MSLPDNDALELTRLRQAVRASGEIIFMTDTAGVFTFVNPQFERLYGHRAEDLVGRETPRVLKGGAVSPDEYAAVWARLRRGETIEREFTNRTKDGRLLIVEATIDPVRDDDGRHVGFLAIQRDITARKDAERALRDSQAQLQIVTDNTLDLVSRIGLDGTYEYASSSFATVLGYSPASLVGTNALALVHPDDLAGVQAILAATIRRGTTGRGEMRYRAADGRYVWIETFGKVLHDAAGSPVGVILSSRDITARRRHEQALQQSEQRLRVAVALAGMSVFTQDHDLRFTSMYQPQLGRSADEVVGRTDDELLPDDVRAQVTALKHRALNTGERVHGEVSAEIGGRRRVFELIVEPERDAAGQPLGLTGALLDITERRLLEDQLRQSQKLEAVGSLAGGIAHDFNNLLTVILGFADLVVRELEPGSPLRGDIEEIQRAGQSAQALTRQLLIFSRRGIVQPVLLHINDIVRRLEPMLRRIVGEHIEIRVRLGDDVGSVRADASQIEQVVMNLVVNARDAMAAGGSLLIETGTTRLDEASALARGRPIGGSFDTLTVRDSGSGMSPGVLAKLFSPFFTTKPAGKGTGLGLATVHGIVQQAGGFVTVESVVGQGSSFAVFLPHIGSRDDAVAEGDGTASLPRGDETILFVEDDESVRAFGTRALRQCGYTVWSAEGADAALSMADAPNARIDLLITDIVMPGLNGRALAERLVARHGPLKILFVSGFTDDSEILRAIRTAGAPFLPKPFTVESLAHKVRAVLNQF